MILAKLLKWSIFVKDLLLVDPKGDKRGLPLRAMAKSDKDEDW